MFQEVIETEVKGDKKVRKINEVGRNDKEPV